MEVPRSFLFVTWDGGGNVAPVLGIARRLADRGHDVSVLTEPCLQQAVARASARFIPFTRHFTRTDGTEDLIRDWEGTSPIGALRKAFDNVMLGPALIVAEETRRAMQDQTPDVLVADFHMIGTLIAGEAD